MGKPQRLHNQSLVRSRGTRSACPHEDGAGRVEETHPYTQLLDGIAAVVAIQPADAGRVGDEKPRERHVGARAQRQRLHAQHRSVCVRNLRNERLVETVAQPPGARRKSEHAQRSSRHITSRYAGRLMSCARIIPPSPSREAGNQHEDPAHQLDAP
eukprot:CAMPEP_0119374138 /NCGR_PEP_ID=MMETSP1334-20130426/29280_1 /TAXON_ID=127549 /ORGANISM="Calcidiscus leptoporus, Strain RCC1130" /LENGTH=155 /DNA_ID=CAMNT_0007392123 /DNA_START=368 /DNA_END=835 /DNA_ORIENTATION=-